MASFTSPPRTQRPVARQPPQATQPPICSAPTVRICTSAPAARSSRSISCRAVYVQPRGCGLPLIMRIFIVSPHAQVSTNRRAAQGGAPAENRGRLIPRTWAKIKTPSGRISVRRAFLRHKERPPQRPSAFGAVFPILETYARAHAHQQRPGNSAHITMTAIVPQVVAMTVVMNIGG